MDDLLAKHRKECVVILESYRRSLDLMKNYGHHVRAVEGYGFTDPKVIIAENEKAIAYFVEVIRQIDSPDTARDV